MRKLKALCERLFRLPAARQALQLRGAGGGALPHSLGGSDDWDLASLDLQAWHEPTLRLAQLELSIPMRTWPARKLVAKHAGYVSLLPMLAACKQQA